MKEKEKIVFYTIKETTILDKFGFDMEKCVIVIGRINRPDDLRCVKIRNDDQKAGMVHAAVTIGEAGQMRVVDLGTQHGTFVNGKKVLISQTVYDGDRIRVGDTEVSIRCPERMQQEEKSKSGFKWLAAALVVITTLVVNGLYLILK